MKAQNGILQWITQNYSNCILTSSNTPRYLSYYLNCKMNDLENKGDREKGHNGRCMRENLLQVYLILVFFLSEEHYEGVCGLIEINLGLRSYWWIIPIVQLFLYLVLFSLQTLCNLATILRNNILSSEQCIQHTKWTKSQTTSGMGKMVKSS